MTHIAVVDNHGQFTHLEQRALRDLGVDVELIDNETPPEDIDADGLVLSGGPSMDRIGRCADYLGLGIPVLGICLETRVWASHADEVKELPDGFTLTARSDVCDVEAMSNVARELYGVQWHPEVAHTERGDEVFENFIARC